MLWTACWNYTASEEWKTSRNIKFLSILVLLNTVGKFLDTLIKNRLLAELGVKGGPHEYQFGFCKIKSTIFRP